LVESEAGPAFRSNGPESARSTPTSIDDSVSFAMTIGRRSTSPSDSATRQLRLQIEWDAIDDGRRTRRERATRVVGVDADGERRYRVGGVEVERRLAVRIGDEQRVPVEDLGEVAARAVG